MLSKIACCANLCCHRQLGPGPGHLAINLPRTDSSRIRGYHLLGARRHGGRSGKPRPNLYAEIRGGPKSSFAPKRRKPSCAKSLRRVRFWGSIPNLYYAPRQTFFARTGDERRAEAGGTARDVSLWGGRRPSTRVPRNRPSVPGGSREAVISWAAVRVLDWTRRL